MKKIPVLFLIVLLLVSCGSTDNGNTTIQSSGILNYIPRPEYPRPDFERKEWVNLNGRWNFIFDSANIGIKNQWFNNPGIFSLKIMVPFPWQSSLSELGEIPDDYKSYTIPYFQNPANDSDKIGWYQRFFVTPYWKDNNKRIILNFGAVDWEADIWVNGNLVGNHEGGYSPFSLDITDYIYPTGFNNNLVVRVYDPGSSNEELIPIGKQGDLWYTPSSGIWQTVWLESRDTTYLKKYSVKTDISTGDAYLSLNIVNNSLEKSFNIKLYVNNSQGNLIQLDKGSNLQSGDNKLLINFNIPDFKLWTPKNPYLYYFKIKIIDKLSSDCKDEVSGYFAFKDIKIDWAPGHSPEETSSLIDQYKYIFLNNKPIYIRGVLDQGYNPWGIYTYPSSFSIETQLKYVKNLGFNTIRTHIKGPEPYKLYLADKLGLFVIYDIPSLKMMGNGLDETGQSNFSLTMEQLMARDINHPSILWWVIFNENWGLIMPETLRKNYKMQEWLKSMVQEAKEIDPNRPVEDNSAGGIVNTFDHIYTDIQSWHFYYKKYTDVKNHIKQITDKTYPDSTEIWVPGYQPEGQPLINSEFNGLDVYSGDKDGSWYFHFMVNEMRKYSKIQGYIFTELSDVEYEHNGLIRYNLQKKFYGYDQFGFEFSDLNGDNYIVIDTAPVAEYCGCSQIEIPVYYSSFDGTERNLKLYYSIIGWNELGNKNIFQYFSPVTFTNKKYDNTYLGKVNINLPCNFIAGYIYFSVIDENNNLISANYVNIKIRDSSSDNYCKPLYCISKILPENYTGEKWSKGVLKKQILDSGHYITGLGNGYFEYSDTVSDYIKNNVSSVELLMEISSAYNYFNRQTSENRIFTNIDVYVDNNLVKNIVVGDYADSAGFLSYLSGISLSGSHGDYIKISIKDESLIKKLLLDNKITIKLSVDKGNNGLRIYGDDTGTYPFKINVIYYLK